MTDAPTTATSPISQGTPMERTVMAETLLTVEDVAARLGTHPETIRRAIRSKRLTCYRLNGCIRIAPDHLNSYLEASLCPALGQPVQSSKSEPESGASSGGMAIPVDVFQQARRTRLALDKASRTSKPALKVVQQS